MRGLYVHIPFCSSICNYCNFNRGLYDEALKVRYVAALLEEIARARTDEPADTLFFGGGTPSLLEAAEVAAIIRACREKHGLEAAAEVTLETNPETVDAAKLGDFAKRGSIGSVSVSNRSTTGN